MHHHAAQGNRVTSRSNYFLKVIHLWDGYPKRFIVGAANLGSKQMQQIRMSLRGEAVVLMGKNTMRRKAIRRHLENNPALEKLLPAMEAKTPRIQVADPEAHGDVGGGHCTLVQDLPTNIS
ncbi:hypothetical protein QTO34_006432 [Cnephaeus nilssonii]|uniref:Large ribosomal subunit protein uL10 n=1 Tax=Cnephaeus nilssonii TaxID=3371016 RepID=A0AA40HLQ2_CNENI|nr:hypothetical protein QTO34_006432 [Eptesicus nilssonii]